MLEKQLRNAVEAGKKHVVIGTNDDSDAIDLKQASDGKISYSFWKFTAIDTGDERKCR